MCNLGFQSVYSLFNSARDFVCERVFAEPVLVGSRTAGRGDWTGDEQYHDRVAASKRSASRWRSSRNGR